MIIKSIRPGILFLASLTYFLGGGIAHYLGARISWVSFFLGLTIANLLLAGAFLLAKFFSLLSFPEILNYSTKQKVKNRSLILQSAFALFILSGLSTILMVSLSELRWQAGTLLFVGLTLLISFSVPPFSLSLRGYGEIILAVYIGTILPALSYTIQEPEIHRLLLLISFPLTLIALACLLAQNFSTYANDVSINRFTFLKRLTWQFAIPIHHSLIMIAYLLFSSIPFFGISWALIWPIFLALPFALTQILWLQRIGNGGPPLWKFFTILVPTVFGLHTYLLAIAIWLR